MTLMGQDISRLATAISEEIDIPALTLISSRLDVTLSNIAPGATLFESAVKLIEHLKAQRPPQDRQLLVFLQAGRNTTLSTLAGKLLIPGYLSPSGDPHDAILLGTTAFVARDRLRIALKKFTQSSQFTTRVLIVRGSDPGGKTFSWWFVRHLAYGVGANAMRLQLKNKNYTPRLLIEQALAVLGLDPSGLPPATDNPQLALIDPFINFFKGQIPKLRTPFWLVIDDLNDPTITPEIRSAAYALAFAVEELRSPFLWTALLGYNDEISDPELRAIEYDDAEFPEPGRVAAHFDVIATAGQKPLAPGKSLQIANLLFAKFPKLDKEAMNKLSLLFEDAGQKLLAGLHP